MRKKRKLKMRYWAIGLGAGLFILPTVFVVGSIKLSQQNLRKQDRKISAFSEYGFVDVRGQIHVHSCISHDSRGSLDEIAEAAKRSGSVWVILTDHSHSPQILEYNYHAIKQNEALFIFGTELEWRGQGSRLRFFAANYQELNAYGHIEKFKNMDGHNWDAVEIVNFHSNLMTRGNWTRLWKSFLFSPLNIYPYFLTSVPKENLDYWQKLSEKLGKPVPIFAAPDAHQNLRILGLQLDPYDVMLKVASTHIFVEDLRESDREPIQVGAETVLKAIKNGRTYVAFDWLGDTAGFQFWMESEKKRFFSGSIVRSPDRLVIKNPETTRTEIRIFRDNQMVAQKDWVRELAIDNPVPGFWRAEIYKDGQLWIMSSQILVK